MILIVIFISLAGLAEGLMDWLQFRYAFTGDSKFWNPQLSWYNKWKPGTTDVEKFWQSSRALVFLTDGWHLLKWLRNRFIDCAVYVFCILLGFSYIESLCITLGLRLAYGLGFAISYNYIHKL